MYSINELRLDSSDADSISQHWVAQTFKNLEVTPNSTITDLIGLQREALYATPGHSGQSATRNNRLANPLPTLFEEHSIQVHQTANVHPTNPPFDEEGENANIANRQWSMDDRCETELRRRVVSLQRSGRSITESSILNIYAKMTGGKQLTRPQVQLFMERQDFHPSTCRQSTDNDCPSLISNRGKCRRQMVPEPSESPEIAESAEEIYFPSNETLPKVEPDGRKFDYRTLPNTLGTVEEIQLKIQPGFKIEFSEGRRNRKYKMLSTEEKQMIVRECHYLTTHQVSKKYGISVNNICRWRKRCERKTGAGRKVHDPRMEIDLLKWISQVGKKSPLTRQLIRKKAIELSEDDNFKASKGWFERFMNRNRELIRKSGYGTKLPSTQKSVKVVRQPEEQ